MSALGLSSDLSWLLDSDEPWTRYRTRVDLEHQATGDPDVARARVDMVSCAEVRGLIERAAAWPGYALKRHNDAAHPLYALSTLADFGLTRSDPGIDAVAESVLQHFDGDQFETLLWLPRFLTKEEDAERWSWMLCDAPTLLYALLAFGCESEASVRRAVELLALRIEDNGWRCGGSEALPRFSGPGRKADTCPMATTYALKALSMSSIPERDRMAEPAIEALLDHWQHQAEYKLKMFGIGTDFRKLRYPYVWFDILHVTEVLSRFAAALRDPRLTGMVEAITAQADADGRYTASAMFRSSSGWSFADKRSPSPWLTLLVHRIRDRLAGS
jgi:hypothetical protein